MLPVALPGPPHEPVLRVAWPLPCSLPAVASRHWSHVLRESLAITPQHPSVLLCSLCLWVAGEAAGGGGAGAVARAAGAAGGEPVGPQMVTGRSG